MTMTESTPATDENPTDESTLWVGGIPFDDTEQAAAAASLLDRDSDGGRVIHVSHRHAWTADAAWLALMEANDPRRPKLMVRGSTLVRMTPDGLESFGQHSLRDRLSRIATFMRKAPCEPPLTLAQTLLNREATDYWRAPFVDTVTEVPVLSASGRLVTEAGYHAKDRLYYRPAAGLEDVERYIGDHTDVGGVQDARDFLLTELLGDFGFKDEASQANALGLLLLPFVRELIGDGPTPMHAIASSTPGSGKGYLAQACLLPACGLVGMTTESGDADETRKRLTAHLLTAPAAIVFDNLSETLDSSHLAAALTTGEWRDRRIGYSEHVVLKVRNAWVATANGLSMSNELARRTTLIVLDPGEVRPSDRAANAFRHPDLHAWALENRAQLVGAALTLVRHWLAGEARLLPSGEFAREEDVRAQPVRTLGSFTRWAEVVGGILKAADVPGFLENRDQIDATVDVESEEETAFFDGWHSWRGEEPITTADLALACANPMELRSMLPSQLVEFTGGRLEQKLVYWLRSRKGRRYGDLRLDGARSGAKNGRNPQLWVVHRPS